MTRSKSDQEIRKLCLELAIKSTIIGSSAALYIEAASFYYEFITEQNPHSVGRKPKQS